MKYWIITAFLFISSETFASPDDSISLSLVLIEKKIFESNDYSQINKYLFDKSDIQVESNRAEEAVLTLERIDTLHFLPAENSFYFYKLSIARTLAGQFDQALSELWKINTQDDSIKNKIRFLTNFILNEMGNFEECRADLIEDSAYFKCTSASPSSLSTMIDRKDPGKAARLSAILPGMGQIYAGEFGRGLLSFTLTAGFAAFGVYNVTSGYYAMSVVSGFFPALKFYSGGKRLAENLAEKQNSKKMVELKKLYRSQIYSLYYCN